MSTDDKIEEFLGNKLKEFEQEIADHYQNNMVFGKCYSECIICDEGRKHE